MVYRFLGNVRKCAHYNLKYISITTSRIWLNLDVFTSKREYKIIWATYDKKNLTFVLLYYWIYETRCEKAIKCSASLAFYLFFPTRLLKTSIYYIQVLLYMTWHEISNNVVCATGKASDQPAHMRSLIRAFASRLHILSVLSYWLNNIWRF